MASHNYTTPYIDAIKRAEEALQWAEKSDVGNLRDFLLKHAEKPLICVSSGGSGSAMSYCAMMYATNYGLGRHVSPLTFASFSDNTIRNSKVLLLTNDGNSTDVRYVINRVKSVGVKDFCLISKYNKHEANYALGIAKEITKHWYLFNYPSVKGFIATLSAISQFSLIYKAFTNDTDITSRLIPRFDSSDCYKYSSRVEGYDVPSFNAIKNFIVLYGGYGEAVANDFESKMAECGVGSATVCDFRNFTHGRFIVYSANPKETAIILIRTPREKAFTEKLFNAKVFRGNDDVFPKETPIVTIDSEFDEPLAAIDLLIKSSILFHDIAQSKGIEPNDPKQEKGYNIDKRVPKLTPFDGIETITLNNDFEGSKGNVTMAKDKAVSIIYDPKKSIEKNARANGVSVDAIRLYIKNKKIDRALDEKINIYNKVWREYYKDSTTSILSLAKRLKISVLTARKYLLEVKIEDLKPSEGKIGLATIHKDITDVRKMIDKIGKDKKYVVKKEGGKYVVTVVE